MGDGPIAEREAGVPDGRQRHRAGREGGQRAARPLTDLDPAVAAHHADYVLDAAEAIRLLGPARMVLDRCAEGVADPGEAADMAQRIVDIIGHPVTDEPPHALVLIEQLADAVFVAAEFFTARDEMNARVHLAEPRWSAITIMCNEAVTAWRQWRWPHPENPTPSIHNDGDGCI